MRKGYFLGTCSTCNKIIKSLPTNHGIEMQDIKLEAITQAQLDEMYQLAGSYEALFSRRSMKYRAWDLHLKTLTEKDFKELILKEYTFLKRPVFIVDGEIFIGNAKAAVEPLIAKLSEA